MCFSFAVKNTYCGHIANLLIHCVYVQASLRDALHRDGTQICGQNIRVSVAQSRQGEYRQQPKQEFGDQRFGERLLLSCPLLIRENC